MSREDRTLLWQHMRAPVLSFAALMVLLGINVLLGAFHAPAVAEALVVVCMVLIVLLVSMEVIHEPPIIRLVSGLGFFWVAILFGMTLVDYLTR